MFGKNDANAISIRRIFEYEIQLIFVVNSYHYELVINDGMYLYVLYEYVTNKPKAYLLLIGYFMYHKNIS